MKDFKVFALCAGVALAMSACTAKNTGLQTTMSGLKPNDFEREYAGKKTALYTLKNASGMEVCITNFGGRIVSVMVPDRDGNMCDVVLGFDSVADYFPENNSSDFGAAIGRYANRINQGRIVIDGDTIQLPQNNYGHCLHGGPTGWQYKVFDVQSSTDNTLVLSLESPDGDNNFPGNVKATISYTLTDDNAIDIDYKAVTDKKTIVNLTNHSYFNLSGNADNKVTGDLLYVNADNFTPVDSTFMTTGEIVPVAGTPMDFTTPKAIGEEIDNYDYVQLKNGNGYDHNWVLNTAGDDSQVAARLMSPATGITLEVYTDEPGVQVYTGNFLDGTVVGKKGKTYQQRTAICLETQHYPDSPNKADWPSVILEPGQTYSSHCVFKFDVEK